MFKVYALEFLFVVLISVLWVHILDKHNREQNDDTTDTE